MKDNWKEKTQEILEDCHPVVLCEYHSCKEDIWKTEQQIYESVKKVADRVRSDRI